MDFGRLACVDEPLHVQMHSTIIDALAACPRNVLVARWLRQRKFGTLGNEGVLNVQLKAGSCCPSRPQTMLVGVLMSLSRYVLIVPLEFL